MSDPHLAPAPPSFAEMDGRIAELDAQRAMAQNRCIILAGRNAELLDLLKLQRAENERLNGLLSVGGEAAGDVATSVEPLPAR